MNLSTGLLVKHQICLERCRMLYVGGVCSAHVAGIWTMRTDCLHTCLLNMLRD